MVWTLADQKNAGEPDATNNFAEPERIISRQTEVISPTSPRFSFRFPALSLSVLKWERQ